MLNIYETYRNQDLKIAPKAMEYFCEHLDGWIEENIDGNEAQRSMVLAAADRMFLGFVDAAARLCESPIEQIMLAGLVCEGYGYRRFPVEIYHPKSPFALPTASDVVIIPQHVVGDYRLDFAVLVQNFNGEVLHFGVECDGHEFHEKTKKQAQRDKARDRALLASGWRVFRFTGSEIWKDVFECAMEVGDFGSDWIEQDMKARGIIK